MTNRILLVEDNESDEKLTLRTFKSTGIANEVTVARDGVEALEYLFGTSGGAGGGAGARPPANLPALVLLDLRMPRIDGLEVLRRIRGNERTKYVPVVVLTSSQEDEDHVRSLGLGANAFVRKPVDHREFVKAAQAVGLFWLLLNERPPGRAGR